jgi:hypothetical protein
MFLLCQSHHAVSCRCSTPSIHPDEGIVPCRFGSLSVSRHPDHARYLPERESADFQIWRHAAALQKPIREIVTGSF